MSNYKAIIFDLGKVIFDLSFDRVFQSWADASGQQFEDIKNRFLFDEVSDKFERNEISASQFRIAISKRLNLNLSDDEFDQGWCNLYLNTYHGIDDLLINLKRNYKLVALTNTNIIHSKIWKVRYDETLFHFEKIFCSHEMGTRKPEAGSYNTVIDYLQFNPVETIFLDDNIENVNGAAASGIETVWVVTPEQISSELLKLGLTI